jgi:pilus assembly protein CpaB
MKSARLLVLVIAIVAGLGAAYMLMGTKEPPPAPVTIVAPPPIPTDSVLVATRQLGPGTVLDTPDLRWQSWPKAQVPPGSIQMSLQPNATQELKGMVVRSEMLAGDPLRRERLAKDAGFMSAVLPSGSRAVAIDLADQGKSAAGGFILPNDRVDVIRIFHPDDAPGAFASETILTNGRVLAVGQAVQDKAGERTVIGGTATLELTPEQAEKVVLAQRTGQLTLTLRSVADAAKLDKTADAPQTMTIIRFGNSSQSRVH